MIIEGSLIISVFGNEPVEDAVGEQVYLYSIDENSKLVMSKATINKVYVENYDVVSVDTKGRRGSITCIPEMKVLISNGTDDIEKRVLDLKNGDRIKGIRNSVITYEIGDKIGDYHTVKKVDSEKYTGYMYELVLEGSQYYMVNSLIVYVG
ncbi:MAG: hypothetical protein ACOCRO_05430 [Halanaerobiales bacterium]